MKILIFVNTKLNLSNKSASGGIEILNIELANYLKKKKLSVVLTNKIDKNIVETFWDVIISSNDAKIFNKTESKRKILWLHNKLQIEKSLRKCQLLPILSNKIEAIFVSKYLEKNTSKFYNFYKRNIIANFLPKIFTKKKITYKNYSKKIFIWSVQREKGLDYVLDLWIEKIHSNYPKAEFHVFSVNKKNNIMFKNNNIFFHGRVERSKLINFYQKATGMICLGYDETFCLNAIESMSMGLPVISLGKTALSELIINDINGIKIDNLSQVEKSIIKLINLDNISRKKLTYSTKKFSKKFFPAKILEQWGNLLLK